MPKFWWLAAAELALMAAEAEVALFQIHLIQLQLQPIIQL
jgi:hypothetical protein